MTALEGCLIIIGIIAVVISYFISEKSAEEIGRASWRERVCLYV